MKNKTNQKKKTVHQKESEFGLPFQAQNAASADRNIYGHVFVNVIEAVEQSYYLDINHTNLNPRLNVWFVPFRWQPPCIPTQHNAPERKANARMDSCLLLIMPL